jgi:hypothetical protein
LEASLIAKNNCAYEMNHLFAVQFLTLISALVTGLFCFAGLSPRVVKADDFRPNSTAGTGAGVIVQNRFGGQILGFDIDQASHERVLTEYQNLDNGNVLAAVETFSQTTGQILRVILRTQRRDDFVTLGVVGNSVGLVEREHPRSLFNVVRSFLLLNPLSSNQVTGMWTPPVGTDHLVSLVSRNQGTSTNAVWTMDVSGNFRPTVFSSNIAANTFGPVIEVTDSDFNSGADSGFAYNSVKNQAVLGHATLGNPFVPGKIATVDLTTGTFTKFTGVGLGDVNGLAVDSSTGTACTTTEIDFSVEFYNLATQTGFAQPLPGATQQFFSGADVEFDPVNKLFLAAQPNSTTASSGSSIHVYDVSGNLIKSVNGLNFSNAFNVISAHIALNPARRIGFVDGPDIAAGQIQSFTY